MPLYLYSNTVTSWASFPFAEVSGSAAKDSERSKNVFPSLEHTTQVLQSRVPYVEPLVQLSQTPLDH